MRTFIRPLATAILILVLAAPARAADPLMPPQLRAHVKVTDHSYGTNRHYAKGKLRLYNASGHRMTVDCRVTLTWKRRNGDLTQRHRDLDGLQVGAGEIRKAHWHMMLKDPDRKYQNTPSNAVPHCRHA